MVCRDWAAVHADASSKIWEAANVCDMMHRALEMSVRDFGAGDVCLWLARRAPGLRQLEVFKSSYDPRCMDASTASDRFDRYETSAGAQVHIALAVSPGVPKSAPGCGCASLLQWTMQPTTANAVMRFVEMLGSRVISHHTIGYNGLPGQEASIVLGRANPRSESVNAIAAFACSAQSCGPFNGDSRLDRSVCCSAERG